MGLILSAYSWVVAWRKSEAIFPAGADIRFISVPGAVTMLPAPGKAKYSILAVSGNDHLEELGCLLFF